MRTSETPLSDTTESQVVEGIEELQNADVVEFWKTRFTVLCRSISVQCRALLNWNAPYGIAESRGVRRGAETIVDYYISVAELHPTKVILCQIGEFYELFGFGALVAVDVLSLNRMGSGSDSLRAGFPLAQLSTKIQALTAAQYGVVICNQKASSAGSTGRKSRHIAGVVTPGSPFYVHDAAMTATADSDAGASDVQAVPYLGLSHRIDGFSLYQIFPDKSEIQISRSMSKSSVHNFLQTHRFAYPLLLISTQNKGIEQVLLDVSAQHPVRKIVLNQELLRGQAEHDDGGTVALSHFICRELGRDSSVFAIRDASRASFHVPYYTAVETGVLPERGVPDALPFILTADAPALVRAFTRQLLISPPDSTTAALFRRLNKDLAVASCSTGKIFPLDAGRLIRAFAESEVSPSMFREVASTAESLAALPENLFTISADLAARFFSLTPNSLYCAALNGLSQQISAVIAPEDCNDDCSRVETVSESMEGIFEDERDDVARFFSSKEAKFRRRVLPSSCANAYGGVKLKAELLVKEILTLLAVRTAGSKLAPGKKKVSREIKLSFDAHNETLNFKGRGIFAGFLPAQDRFGQIMIDRQTTSVLQSALEAYDSAVRQAIAAVSFELKSLSNKLFNTARLSLEHCAEQSVVFLTALCHTEKSISSRWGMAELRESGTLSLHGVVPYWLAAGKDRVVANDIDFDRFVVLTGANAAGKSTLLRSVALCVLLTHCGFYAPLKDGIVPLFGGVFLRMGAEDSPLEGLSSFANEMRDMAEILSHQSDKPLFILADEVGKGTESSSGAALASAILNQLIKMGHHGVFATHWLELMSMSDLHFHSQARFLSMEVEKDVNGELRPTWRVTHGVAQGSLAFETALRYGIPSSIVTEARTTQKLIQEHWQRLNSSEKIELVSQGLERVSGPHDELSPSNEKTESLRIAETVLITQAKPWIDTVLSVASEVLSERGFVSILPLTVPPGHRPPLATVSRACVYVLQTVTDFFYVGESIDFRHRLKQHRESTADRCSATAFVYVMPGGAGKGDARIIETILISRLRAIGTPLLSDKDGQHSVFP